MKFNDIKKIQDDVKNISIHKTHSEQNIQKNLIETTYRYNNVGVYIMKNGKKGLFHEMASYINNGENPTSWALKISNAGGWSIQFGINPNTNHLSNDIYLADIFSVFEQKYENVHINGNNKVVLISGINDRHQTEEIANYIINMFKDIQLDFTDKKLYEEFNIEESEKALRIIGFYSENKIDEQSHEKYIDIINKFSEIKMSQKDSQIFNEIKSKIKNEKILSEDDKLHLNDLMRDYFTTHDRVSIAMKYLKKD